MVKAAYRFFVSARASRAAVGTLPVWTGSKTRGEFNGQAEIEKIGELRNGPQVNTPVVSGMGLGKTPPHCRRIVTCAI